VGYNGSWFYAKGEKIMGGKGIVIPKIELPLEAQIVIRKCTNRGLILTRKGEVFEMELGHSYKINEDCEVFSHKLSNQTKLRTSASTPNLGDEDESE